MANKKNTKTTKTVEASKSSGKQRGRKRANNAVDNKVKEEKKLKLESLQVEGHLLSCGQGDIGQLGQGDDVMEKTRPGLVIFEDESVTHSIVDIAAGGMHNVCLTSKGEVYTFGCNDEGALGRVTEGKEGAEFKAERVDLPCKVVQISAGDCHSAALSEDGIVYIWGTFRDSSGSMGLISKGKIEMKPVVLIDHIQIVKIQSGYNHMVCLSKDGEIFTCGCAEQGQLGRVAEYFANRGGRKGIEWILSPGKLNLQKVKSKRICFEDVWAGSYATYAKVKGTNQVLACGLNNYFQLGLEDMHTRFQPELVQSFDGKDVTLICGGQHHSLAVDKQGEVYAMGRKEYGRLGLGENCPDATEPTVIPTLKGKKCSELSCGISVSFSIDQQGDVYSWGMGSNSQLGHGDDEDRFVPTHIASKGMLARKALKVSSGGQHTIILALKKEEA